MAKFLEKKKTIVVKKLEPVLVPPAAETKNGLYFLSNLDQYRPFIIGTVYCFHKADTKSSDNASEVIKQALAKVLVHYHPLAGRLVKDSNGKLAVDCTAEGSTFVEAFADYELKVLGDISTFDHATQGKLIHTLPDKRNILDIPILTAQVTRFRCGGFVLGIGINHCLVDGTCAMEFVNSWAEIARGLPISIPPFLDRNILRSREPPKIEFPHHEFQEIKDGSKAAVAPKDEEILYKYLCFDAEKLTQMKKIAMEDGVIEKCTNFTVVAAYCWRVHTNALKMEPHELTKLIFTTDFRSKFDPPIPKGFFGNATFEACCLCSAGELTVKPLSFAVKLVQEALKMVTEEYVRSAIDHYEVERKNPMFTATLTMASWTRLAFYTTDFGWGTPIQVGHGTPPPNMVFIVPHGEGRNSLKMELFLHASIMSAYQEPVQI